MDFSFNGVKAAADRGFTSPGTIDVFTIEEIKLEKNDNGKENFNIIWGRPQDTFRERYFLTEKAAPRFVYIYEKLMGTEVLPDAEDTIVSNLKGKKLALKVSGSINDESGKGYTGLGFSGYARKPELINELSWTDAETAKNAAVIAAINKSSSNGEGASKDLPGNPSDADKF